MHMLPQRRTGRGTAADLKARRRMRPACRTQARDSSEWLAASVDSCMHVLGAGANHKLQHIAAGMLLTSGPHNPDGISCDKRRREERDFEWMIA